jgi:cell fate regulator YaaT (PSP1 superfamily)
METIKKLLVNVYVLAMEKSFYFITEDKDYKKDELIIVETPRGIELGKVVSEPVEKDILETDEYPKVIKKGDEKDLEAYNINVDRAKESIKIAQEEADKLNLDMKIVSADYTLDSTKIIICYLSETRVDFRDLLKVLANDFKCRIELRQIGTRDKAKMIGGIGICGLKLCCSTFLNEFDGISITMAKNQMLALNIPKLSGHCGKLICCLKYENDAYTELQKELPRIGTRVRYEDNIYKITSMNVITKMIRIENKENIATVPYDTIKDNLLPRDYPMNQPLPSTSKVEKENTQEVPVQKDVTKEIPVPQKEANDNHQGPKEKFNKDNAPRRNQNSSHPFRNNNQSRPNSFQKNKGQFHKDNKVGNKEDEKN